MSPRFCVFPIYVNFNVTSGKPNLTQKISPSSSNNIIHHLSHLPFVQVFRDWSVVECPWPTWVTMG